MSPRDLVQLGLVVGPWLVCLGAWLVTRRCLWSSSDDGSPR